MDKFYPKLLLVFVLFVCLNPIGCFSQKTNKLEYIVNDFLAGNNVYDQIDSFVYKEGAIEIINATTPYLNHDNRQVRGLIYKVLRKVIFSENDLKIKQKGVYILCANGLLDSDSGNVFVVVNYLREFEKECFNKDSKNFVASIIVQHPPHFSELLKLIGELEITQLLPYLELSLQDQKMSSTDFWSLNLVLARWGDETKVKYCVESVERLGLSDEVVFRLIPDLIYINNKIVFDYLFEEIQKNDLNCLSTDPDNEVEISCSYRLIEFISPHILDFPISLSATGELNMDNYEEALESVRTWIESNKNSYQLNNN